jgi:hypothetical protein
MTGRPSPAVGCAVTILALGPLWAALIVAAAWSWRAATITVLVAWPAGIAAAAVLAARSRPAEIEDPARWN